MTTPHFTIDAKVLAEALALTLASAEVKGTEPILSFVLMDARDGKLHLTATDRVVAITTAVDAVVTSPVTFCMPMKRTADLVKLIDGKLAFTVSDPGTMTGVRVKFAGGSHRLPAMEADRFPAIESAEDVKLTIDGPLLSSMLTAAMIAMETNPNGEDRWKAVELAAADGKLSVTGICGPRMANATVDADGEFYALLPTKGAVALVTFAAKAGDVTIAMSANLLTVRSATSSATFKLSANKWPDWHAVIAVKFAHAVELHTDTLIPTLRRALLACETNKMNTSRVDFELGGQVINLFAQSPEKGDGTEMLTLDCPSLNGSTLKVAFAANQLMDFFKVVRGPFIWQLDESHSVLRFTPKEPLAFEYQYVQGKLRI